MPSRKRVGFQVFTLVLLAGTNFLAILWEYI
jgi:hypothetical protein